MTDVISLSYTVYFLFAHIAADRTARLWSTDRVTCLRVFVGHLGDVQCVKLHPACTYVVSCSSDKTIRLWDVHSGHCVRTFTGHCAGVASLAVCPSGR
jgi:transcription initiation factor TFIID subunit 5